VPRDLLLTGAVPFPYTTIASVRHNVTITTPRSEWCPTRKLGRVPVGFFTSQRHCPCQSTEEIKTRVAFAAIKSTLN